MNRTGGIRRALLRCLYTKKGKDGADMNERGKRTAALCALLLLSALSVFAVQRAVIGGTIVGLRYIPSVAAGAAAAVILYCGGFLKRRLFICGPVWGTAGFAVTAVWALLAGQEAPLFRFDLFGWRAIFTLSEFHFFNSREINAFAPYIGDLTAFIIGGILALSVVSAVCAARLGRIADCIRPNKAAVFWFVLPFACGSLEYGIHTFRCWVEANMFSLRAPSCAYLLLFLFPLYFLIGMVFGLFCVKKHAVTSRLAAVLIIICSGLLWYMAVFGLMHLSGWWASAVQIHSLYIAGVSFGFTAGVAVRALCARRMV